MTDPKVERIFVKRGKKDPVTVFPGSGKEMYTVLSCVSASGHVYPPFMLFKGKNLYEHWCHGAPLPPPPPGTGYGATDSGWMMAGPFYNWFKNVFIPQLGPNPSKIPYLLIFDGHESHISYNLLRTAIDNNIHILCLPAHCSHLPQPLDVSVFRAAKVTWKKILKDHYRQTRLKKASVRKEVFPSLIAKLYDSAFKQEQVMSGFRKCGIFPFSRTVIPKEKMLPAQMVADSPNTSIASVDATNNSVAFDDTYFGVMLN